MLPAHCRGDSLTAWLCPPWLLSPSPRSPPATPQEAAASLLSTGTPHEFVGSRWDLNLPVSLSPLCFPCKFSSNQKCWARFENLRQCSLRWGSCGRGTQGHLKRRPFGVGYLPIKRFFDMNYARYSIAASFFHGIF